MLKFFYRKLILPVIAQDKYNQDIYMLLFDEYKINFMISFIFTIFSFFPVSLFINSLFGREDILSKITAIIIYIIFMTIYFKLMRKYMYKLINGGTIISNFIFFSIYTSKGNAILREDFKRIKEYDKSVYHSIKTKECEGLCYQTCFSILQALKRGSIKYIAVRALQNDNKRNKFTLHVLYVNDGWCFDTFSRKQYLVDDLMNLYQAKEFANFSYDDIEGKTYKEFKKDNSSALENWCIENDCYQSIV